MIHRNFAMFAGAFFEQDREGTAGLGRRLIVLSTAVLVAGAALIDRPLPSVATETQQISSPVAPSSPKDNQFTLEARRALAQDEDFAALNLGVTVRAGVAYLWGTAPSQALVRRAAERIRQVPGLSGVRSEVRIIAAEEKIESASRSDRGSKIEDRGSKTQSRAATASYKSMPSDPPALMPPISVPVRQSSHDQTESKKSVEPARAGEKLADMILQIRQSDVRYRGIRFEIRSGDVRLWGVCNQADNLFAMAQAVSRLEGVKRVIVDRQ